MSKSNRISQQRKLLSKPLFHERDKHEDAQELSQALISQARKSGHLNLSGRGLTSIPEKIWNLLDTEASEVNYSFNNQNADTWWNMCSLKTLDLSNNSISIIESKIQNLSDLEILNLKRNTISTLPNEFSHLNNLTSLNLSHNVLCDNVEVIFQLKELIDLNLSHNKIQQIPNNIYELSFLQNLDLSYNCLESLPPDVGFLTRLCKLNLNNNNLTDIPSEIVGLRVLSVLEISNNKIKRFPDQMCDLTKLQIIYAQHNDIEALPNLEKPFNLKELYLGNNFISEITEDFCINTPLMAILELRDNEISTIHENIAMMQHLTRLDLTNNNLLTIPASLATLSQLQSLQIEGNQIRSIRREVIQRGTLSILKVLREKMLDSGMDTIGECLKSMLRNDDGVDVEIPDRHTMEVNHSLCLNGRDISVIPDKIFDEAKEAGVSSIDLSKNKICDFPVRIFSICDTLQDLNLKGNLLKTIPTEIECCIHLRYLDISQNSISQLPDIIENLHNLREVCLSYNRFTSIPDCLYSLPFLEILLIRDNKITELVVDSSETKKGLSSLKKLAVLDVSNNNIHSIPPELGNMRQIRTLEIRGNLFKQPRLAIVDKGTESILSYLRGRIAE